MHVPCMVYDLLIVAFALRLSLTFLHRQCITVAMTVIAVLPYILFIYSYR